MEETWQVKDYQVRKHTVIQNLPKEGRVDMASMAKSHNSTIGFKAQPMQLEAFLIEEEPQVRIFNSSSVRASKGSHH